MQEAIIFTPGKCVVRGLGFGCGLQLGQSLSALPFVFHAFFVASLIVTIGPGMMQLMSFFE